MDPSGSLDQISAEAGAVSGLTLLLLSAEPPPLRNKTMPRSMWHVLQGKQRKEASLSQRHGLMGNVGEQKAQTRRNNRAAG